MKRGRPRKVIDVQQVSENFVNKGVQARFEEAIAAGWIRSAAEWSAAHHPSNPDDIRRWNEANGA